MTAGGTIAAVLLVAAAGVARADDPGTFVPEYPLPAVGSYELPPIQTVRDHPVLDEDGRDTTLFAAARDRIAIVAFVYTTCAESSGCPLSTAVLHRIDRTIADDPRLRDRVALVSVSFDPDRDGPARMREQRTLHAPRATWRFLTTRDAAMLAPVLADFGQRVDKLTREDGSWTGLFRHVLKVFLVDGRRRVRNVYSVGFLHADLVLNDVRTVLAAQNAP